SSSATPSNGTARSGSRSVGQTSPRSVCGTSDRLGPPSSSAAWPTASNLPVAALRLSYSSGVNSRGARFAMMVTPLRMEKGAEQLAHGRACRKMVFARPMHFVGFAGAPPPGSEAGVTEEEWSRTGRALNAILTVFADAGRHAAGFARPARQALRAADRDDD